MVIRFPFLFELCLATIGVAFFSASASVGALFNYGGIDYVKTLNNSFFGGIVDAIFSGVRK